MARPGVEITQSDIPPPRSSPTETGVWFAVGVTGKGKQEPITCKSLSQFEEKCGARLTTSFLYDAVETYFREGGDSVIIGRVIGPGAVQASRTLMDGAGTPDDTLVVTSRAYGADGNTLTVQVTHPTGSTYTLLINYGGVLVETAGPFDDPQDAVDWSEGSAYVTIVRGSSALIPAVLGASALTGGTDDAASATVTQVSAALALFVPSLGPGQVSAPGYTATDVHQAVLNHADNNGRVALLDSPDTATQATVTARVVSDRASEPRKGGTFWPWLKVPGLTTSTRRTVPPSALAAAKCAQVDALGNPNLPGAGLNRGVARWVTDLSQAPVTESQREALNSAGVNVIREYFGAIVIYGWRTLVDESSDPGWIDLGNTRLNMAISAKANATAEQYVFEQIDGREILFSKLGGKLTADLLEFYQDGALYGTNASEAFFVDTGSSVNTAESIADHKVRAKISYRPSPMAELVEIDIVKTAPSGSVS